MVLVRHAAVSMDWLGYGAYQKYVRVKSIKSVGLSDGTEHVLPNPKKDDELYTLAELCFYLRPFYRKGTKRIVDKLREDKKILFSSATLNRYLKK